MNFSPSLSVILFVSAFCWNTHAVPATGRTIYSTPMRQRAEPTSDGTCGRVGMQRIFVTFQNISNVAQTVTVNITDIDVTTEGGGSTPAAAAAALPSWIVNSGYPNYRFKQRTLPTQSETLTIDPLKSASINWSIKCDARNNQTCTIGHTEPLTTDNPGLVNVVFNARFAVKLVVAEDRGALLADLYAQILVSNCSSVYQNSETRAINGGRPF